MPDYRDVGPEISPSVPIGYVQGLARVQGLRDGGFVVSWLSADDDRTVYDGDLLARTYDAAGNALQVAPVVIRADTAPNQSLPIQHALTSLPNGGFAAAWTDDSVDPNSSTRDIAYRLFDRAGTPVTDALRLTDGGRNSRPAVSAAQDGRLIIAWSDAENYKVKVAFVSPDGLSLQKTAEVLNVDPAGTSNIYTVPGLPSVTALANGTFIIAWDSFGGPMKAALLAANGEVLNPRIVLPTGTDTANIQVSATTNGFVAIWTASEASSGMVHFRQFDLEGRAIGNDVAIAGSDSFSASITVLADGGLIATYQDASDNAFLQAYDAAGRMVGNQILLNNNPDISYGDFPFVDTLSDSGIVVAWTNRFGGPRAQILNDDVIAGTAAGETLTGSAGADVFRGFAGNDMINAGAGIDAAVFAGLFAQSTVVRGASTTTVRGPDGADTLTGVELFRFADGTLVFDADAPGAQVQRLYAAVLDRPADQIGLEHWLDQIGDRGQSIQSVAAYFLQSPEFQASGANVAANGAFVDFLYTQVLGRAADAAGRADWVARLDAGLARSDALLFFSESQEHRALTTAVVGQGYFETDDAYQTIALLYDTFAQRKPDAAGLIGWSEALKSGGATIEAIADGFAASPEFQNGIAGKSRGQIVDYLYQNTLDRPADAAGHAYWMGQLDGGVSIGRMLLYFAISDEHQALLAPWVTGGIDVTG